MIPASEVYMACRMGLGSTVRGWLSLAADLDAAAIALAAEIPAGDHHPDSQPAVDALRVKQLHAAAQDCRRRALCGREILAGGGALFTGGDLS